MFPLWTLAELSRGQVGTVLFIVKIFVFSQLLDHSVNDLKVCPAFFKQPFPQLTDRTRFCGEQLYGSIHCPVSRSHWVTDRTLGRVNRRFPLSPHWYTNNIQIKWTACLSLTNPKA